MTLGQPLGVRYDMGILKPFEIGEWLREVQGKTAYNYAKMVIEVIENLEADATETKIKENYMANAIIAWTTKVISSLEGVTL